MKTLKEYFEKHSSHPKFEKIIWKMGGLDWKDFKSYPTNYLNPNTGSVPGCIYYDDTVPFAKKYLGEILQILIDFEFEMGMMLKIPNRHEDETTYYNWLTWFAWETLAFNLYNYLSD